MKEVRITLSDAQVAAIEAEIAAGGAARDMKRRERLLRGVRGDAFAAAAADALLSWLEGLAAGGRSSARRSATIRRYEAWAI